jgi:plastocyanin
MTTTSKLVFVSIIFAFLGLGLALINDFGFVSYLGIKPSITGILALVFATASFFMAMRKGSFLVSASLIAQGVSDVSAAILAGAIIGVPFGSWILALGLVKAVISARSVQKKMRPIAESPTNLLKTSHGNAISRILLVIILVVIVLVSAVSVLYVSSLNSSGSSCNTTLTSSANSLVQISISKGASSQSGAPGYSPDTVTLVLGLNNTIIWKNNDSTHHTVTTSSAPSGASFNSGDIAVGAVLPILSLQRGCTSTIARITLG